MENFITHIEIKNLWGLYDIAFDCDPKVNILVGKNGSGKSTVLRMIVNDLSYKEVFRENQKVSKSIHKKSLGKGFDGEIQIFKHQESTLRSLIVDTFDIAIKDKRKINKSNTPLDVELKELINTNFVKLESILNSQALNFYKQKQPNSGDELTRKLDGFYEIINSFFKDTNKKVEFTEEKNFIFKNGIESINTNQLSSGEKQLLVILINIFLLEEKPTIVLMDEPELSLHPSWQRILIETIQKINPNIQLFLTTHSPSILSHGWKDKLIHLEDFTSKSETVSN